MRPPCPWDEASFDHTAARGVGADVSNRNAALFELEVLVLDACELSAQRVHIGAGPHHGDGPRVERAHGVAIAIQRLLNRSTFARIA
jgi:hypothetical protein